MRKWWLWQCFVLRFKVHLQPWTHWVFSAVWARVVQSLGQNSKNAEHMQGNIFLHLLFVLCYSLTKSAPHSRFPLLSHCKLRLFNNLIFFFRQWGFIYNSRNHLTKMSACWIVLLGILSLWQKCPHMTFISFYYGIKPGRRHPVRASDNAVTTSAQKQVVQMFFLRISFYTTGQKSV